MKARMGGGRKEPTSLTVQAKMWPTPRASDAFRGADKDSPNRGGTGMKDAFLLLETPGSGTAGLDLNPLFVEQLMGVPLNWSTASTSLETDSYLSWLASHSFLLRSVLASWRS